MRKTKTNGSLTCILVTSALVTAPLVSATTPLLRDTLFIPVTLKLHMLLKPMSFLLFLLFLSLNHADCTGGDQFAFSGFTGADLDLDGMAIVMPNGLLMLTNGTYQMKGHAFRPDRLQFHASPNSTAVRSFSTTFVFAIISEYVELSGHGITFFIAPSKNFSTALPSQYFSLFNIQNNGNASNHIFAVELDTILNAEFQDINSNHVGINVNGLKSIKAASAGYYIDETGVFQNVSLFSRKVMQLWVDYDGQTMELNVTLAPVEVSKPKKPLLSATVDLSTVVTDSAYVGLSSSTGSFITCHYVLGWSFSLNGIAPSLDYSKLPKLPRTSTNHRSKVLAIVLPIATPMVVLTVLAAVFLFVWRRFKYAELQEEWEVEFGPHRFSYKDLFIATDGFKGKKLLGIGGFGRVYKGVLPTSNMEVAVKKVSHDSRQGMKQFIAEVVSIGRLRHRNIVQLLGYCRRKDELLLIYDYMPNGSLDKWLYDRNRPPLDWAQRFRIIKGVASGLLYLHEDWEQVVIHRDIKASNVLLDGEMNGRLGDFGLARLYDRGADPQTTHVVGTMGYLAPELAHTRKVTPVTDVFAFGSFLLEVVCGRRPIEYDEQDNRLVLVDWVLEHWHKRSITDTVDQRLRGGYVVEEVMLVLQLGLLCSHPLPSARPGMRQVVQYLDGGMPLPELAPTYLSFSMLALMQNEGFDSYVMSFPPSVGSIGTMSGLSGGR